MQFFIALYLLVAPAFADLPKGLPKETDTATDTRNDSCARLSVAAKSGQSIAADSEAIASCSAGSYTVCSLTRQYLDENAATKGLLPACTGPREVAASFPEQAINACKIGIFVLNCMVNGLPTQPSMTDIATPGISRPSEFSKPGITSK